MERQDQPPTYLTKLFEQYQEPVAVWGKLYSAGYLTEEAIKDRCIVVTSMQQAIDRTRDEDHEDDKNPIARVLIERNWLNEEGMRMANTVWRSGDRNADHPAPWAPLPSDEFDPPQNYDFEPELAGPVPRRWRPLEGLGWVRRQRRFNFWLCLALATLSTGLARIPAVQRAATDFLLFAYLDWIGLGFVVLGLGIYLLVFLRSRGPIARIWPGPERYFREGEPMVVRVRNTSKDVVGWHGVIPNQYAHSAMIEFRDPESDMVVRRTVTSQTFSLFEKDRQETTYQTNEYATALYFAEDPYRTIQLYGFLGLRPGLGMIERPFFADFPRMAEILVAVVWFAYFFGGIIWGLGPLRDYEPVRLAAKPAVAVIAFGAVLGGALLAVGLLALAHFEACRKGIRRRGRFINAPEVPRYLEYAALGGCLLHGAMLAFCLAIHVNATYDESPGLERRVEIVSSEEKTTKIFTKEYLVYYRFPGSEEQHRWTTTQEKFPFYRTGTARVLMHTGYLNWPWVKSLSPSVGARPIPKEEPIQE